MRKNCVECAHTVRIVRRQMKRKPTNLYLDSALIQAARRLAEDRRDSLSIFIERLLAKELKAQARKEGAPYSDARNSTARAAA